MPSIVGAYTDADYPVPAHRGELSVYLDWIWKLHFVDVPRVNDVLIEYSYPWKSRLGMIRLSVDKEVTFIGINTLLQMQQVPEYVLITTIAHELVHYAHGFGSPLPQRWQHPHANRVVDKELENRDLGIYLCRCSEWINTSWYAFYDKQRAAGWPGIEGKRHVAKRNV